MSTHVVEGALRLNFTSSTTLNASGPTANLLGVFVASSSSGTLKFADTGGTIANTFNAAAATFYPLPTTWSGTLTITVGGTLDATLFYVPA